MVSVSYRELAGELRASPNSGTETPGPSVILSSISKGASAGPNWSGLTLRYVGRGTEHYRVAGQYCRVGEDQMMISPQVLGSEVEIKGGAELTLGLCIFLPHDADDVAALVDGPVVLPASCGLGIILRNSLRRLKAPVRSADEPLRIAMEAKVALRDTLAALDAQVDRAPGIKRRTRFESVRRLNLARAYLHDVTDRAVSLEELGAAAAMSPYQLLRSFRDCFGETPAAYHRRLRLTLAHRAAAEQGLTYAFVADRFGFAGGASFSHAYRRTFGRAPVRTLGCRAAS